MAHAIEAGHLLIKAKRLVESIHGYGHWQKWQRKNLDCSIRAAQLYMQLAGMPEEDAQRVAQVSLRQAAKLVAKKADGGRWFANGDGSPVPHELRVGDFRDVLADIEPIDLVWTDPLYAREHTHLYGDLALFAKQALKPGGSLLSYAGK